MITKRDIAVLQAVDRYYVLSRPLIQKLCFPDDGKDGRGTRRRLLNLYQQKLVNKQKLLFGHPDGGFPSSIYYPSPRGCEVLHEYFDDERYLTTSTIGPSMHFIPHWLAVSETHIAFDTAVAKETDVKIEGWLNEWDVVNKDESAPEKRYRLYSLLKASPRLVCAPDAAFLLSSHGFKKVFYLEQDRNTSGVRQIAEGKTKGYAAMAELRRHFKHFADANVESFSVIMVTTTKWRRDRLREAISSKPGASLWKFTTTDDLTADSVLHAPIFFPCEGDPVSLMKKKEA